MIVNVNRFVYPFSRHIISSPRLPVSNTGDETFSGAVIAAAAPADVLTFADDAAAGALGLFVILVACIVGNENTRCGEGSNLCSTTNFSGFFFCGIPAA